MRHLVIGGAGFLGASVCARLLREGEEPIAFDVNTSNVLQHIVGADVAHEIVVRGDATDGLAVLDAAKARGADTIIHVAALLGAAVTRDPRAAIRVNSESFLNALETARILGIKKVAYASARSLLGEHREGAILSADSPYRPGSSIYMATKIVCEVLAKHYAEAYHIDSAGMRFTTMLGPGLDIKRQRESPRDPHVDTKQPMTDLWHGIFSELLDKPARGLPGRVPYGDDVANWQWVEDVAHALTLGACSPLPGARIYHVAGDIRPVREAVEAVRRLIPDADVEALPGRHGQQATVDLEPLREDLGFKLEWRMEDQVAWLIEHTRSASPAS